MRKRGEQHLKGNDWFVFVSGRPVGLARAHWPPLAAELSSPLLAKDEIKEALMDGFGCPEAVAELQRLGKATALAMLHVGPSLPRRGTR